MKLSDGVEMRRQTLSDIVAALGANASPEALTQFQAWLELHLRA